jgi:hypothetical protein
MFSIAEKGRSWLFLSFFADFEGFMVAALMVVRYEKDTGFAFYSGNCSAWGEYS